MRNLLPRNRPGINTELITFSGLRTSTSARDRAKRSASTTFGLITSRATAEKCCSSVFGHNHAVLRTINLDSGEQIVPYWAGQIDLDLSPGSVAGSFSSFQNFKAAGITGRKIQYYASSPDST
jgi:hypothetical protein